MSNEHTEHLQHRDEEQRAINKTRRIGRYISLLLYVIMAFIEIFVVRSNRNFAAITAFFWIYQSTHFFAKYYAFKEKKDFSNALGFGVGGVILLILYLVMTFRK